MNLHPSTALLDAVLHEFKATYILVNNGLHLAMQATSHGTDQILTRGELSESILELSLPLLLKYLDLCVVDASHLIYPLAPAGQVSESRHKRARILILSYCGKPKDV